MKNHLIHIAELQKPLAVDLFGRSFSGELGFFGVPRWDAQKKAQIQGFLSYLGVNELCVPREIRGEIVPQRPVCRH